MQHDLGFQPRESSSPSLDETSKDDGQDFQSEKPNVRGSWLHEACLTAEDDTTAPQYSMPSPNLIQLPSPSPSPLTEDSLRALDHGNKIKASQLRGNGAYDRSWRRFQEVEVAEGSEKSWEQDMGTSPFVPNESPPFKEPPLYIAETGQDKLKERLSKFSSDQMFELSTSPRSFSHQHAITPENNARHENQALSSKPRKVQPLFQTLELPSVDRQEEEIPKRHFSESIKARELIEPVISPHPNEHEGRARRRKIPESTPTRPEEPLDPPTESALSSSVKRHTETNPKPLQTSPTLNMKLKQATVKDSDTVQSTTPQPKLNRFVPNPLDLDASKSGLKLKQSDHLGASPMPHSMPKPPLSIPTYLQLELSSNRPSSQYIHRSTATDSPYESSRVKLERLTNFLLLPPQLEQVLWFGALACLDSWLYSFTILPLRFFKALYSLLESCGAILWREGHFIGRFIYDGSSRVWQRRGFKPKQESAINLKVNGEDPTQRATSQPRNKAENPNTNFSYPGSTRKRPSNTEQTNRWSKSGPSILMPSAKADLLKGLLIISSCIVLMYFDASMMYHSIRGQAAIKLYVLYNVLEVCDRLFSALGQDILECLFSKETLETRLDGRSKIVRPLWLFTLALIYNVIHATALFYQVVTLNVAVNSYSNALLTLLMSNQFVEIKSTVFKRFDKENLFQLTCADVVERFQLWLMLTIIASRNIIETNALGFSRGSSSSGPNLPRSSGILPNSFTLFPNWTGQVMGPFLLVLGSEMMVDWIKHTYITKFNNTKPAVYGRFLDILAKDYYTNAFADQDLTRRLGLPVIPLSCLFIRASVQTYHMFLATHVPLPIPSTATSLTEHNSSTSTSPATTAALQHVDNIFRRALGRSNFGTGSTNSDAVMPGWLWSTDDVIAFVTMMVFFLVVFLVLLALKLVLGMCLLSFARNRYYSMKEREKASVHADGRRLGGWGVVEVDEDKRRWIYEDDAKGLERLKKREKDAREKESRGELHLAGISRYSMVGKRIW